MISILTSDIPVVCGAREPFNNRASEKWLIQPWAPCITWRNAFVVKAISRETWYKQLSLWKRHAGYWIYFRCIINIFDKIPYCWEHRRTANRSHCSNVRTQAVENRELTDLQKLEAQKDYKCLKDGGYAYLTINCSIGFVDGTNDV